MKSQQFDKRLLLVSVLLVCICQPNMAARMIKGTKATNITENNKQSNQTLEMIGVENETNKTVTITATTNKSGLDTTTLSADFEVDGRHAFINNQFVADADEEPLRNDPAVSEKLPPRPIAGYQTGQTDDYEEEETSDYVFENEAVPENCEDTQESFVDNNDKDIQSQFDQEQDILADGADVEPNIYAETYPNKDFHSPNYKMQTNGNLVGSYYNNKFVPNINRNPGLLYASKPVTKPLAQHLYVQTDANKKQLQNTPQHSGHSQLYHLIKTRPTYNRKTQPSQQTKETFYKPSYNLYEKLNLTNNTTEALNLIMPNFSYGNSGNMPTTSPFSTTSAQNKIFKTVSSSIQYVSTPLADLVFKYSIGMAKHPMAKAMKSSADHHNGNGISEAKNHINGKA